MGTPGNIIAGYHVWVEDPDEAWLDGQVSKINRWEVEIQTSNGKTPHLQWTKLRDMKDGDLDPLYLMKGEQLKKLVASITRLKIVQGKPLNGKEFVSFLEQECSAWSCSFLDCGSAETALKDI